MGQTSSPLPCASAPARRARFFAKAPFIQFKVSEYSPSHIMPEFLQYHSSSVSLPSTPVQGPGLNLITSFPSPQRSKQSSGLMQSKVLSVTHQAPQDLPLLPLPTSLPSLLCPLKLLQHGPPLNLRSLHSKCRLSVTSPRL